MTTFAPFDAWFSAVRFGFEAQQVIAARLALLARGDTPAAIEAVRMVTEKGVAAVEAQAALSVALASGASHAAALERCAKPYRRRVRANYRRLRKRK